MGSKSTCLAFKCSWGSKFREYTWFQKESSLRGGHYRGAAQQNLCCQHALTTGLLVLQSCLRRIQHTDDLRDVLKGGFSMMPITAMPLFAIITHYRSRCATLGSLDWFRGDCGWGEHIAQVHEMKIAILCSLGVWSSVRNHPQWRLQYETPQRLTRGLGETSSIPR